MASKEPKELKCSADWNKLLDSIDTFLVDCHGVLWSGDSDPILGAQDAIAYLRDQGKNVFFVSNNSSKSRKGVLEKFKKPWISRMIGRYGTYFICCCPLCEAYVKVTGKVFLLGQQGFLEEMLLQGIDIVGPGPDPLQGTLQDWVNMELDPPTVDAVVVGLDYHISYMKLIRAASYLAKPECHYVATNEDHIFPTKGKIVIPGTGTMVKAVTHCASRTPIIVGKPHKPMYDVISSLIDMDPDRTCMIGDTLSTDIAFGKNNGLKTLLVFSGITSREYYKTYSGGVIADYTSEDISTVISNNKLKM